MKKSIEELEAAVHEAALMHQRVGGRRPRGKNGRFIVVPEQDLIDARHAAERALYKARHGRNIGDPRPQAFIPWGSET